MFMDIMNEINNDSDILKRLVILSEYVGRERYYKTVYSKLSQLKKKTYYDTVTFNASFLGDNAVISSKERERNLIYSSDSAKNEKEEQFLGIKRLFDFVDKQPNAIGLSNTSICKLHEILYERTSKKTAGKFKTADLDVVTVNKRGKVLNTRKTVAPNFVDLYLTKLINEYQNSSGHPVLKAIVFIADFLTIHPFQDGNSVVAQSLVRYFLMKEDIELLNYFCLERHIYNNYDRFVKVSEDKNVGFTQKKYNVAMVKSFVLFFINALIDGFKTLEEDIAKLNKTKYNKRDDVIDVIMGIEGQFTINSILENLEIIINKQTVNRIIKELLDDGKLDKYGDRKNTKYQVNLEQ